MQASDFFDLTGKVAVVTGASSGLGQGACTALAARGALVVAVARRKNKLQAWSDTTQGETAILLSLIHI